MKIEIEVDSVKMTREALCIAEMEVIRSGGNYSSTVYRRLASLIQEMDKHRPLGPDGKHGDLHTETCGCEDKR